MSVLGVFDIAKTAIFTTKKALDTTAHNVANTSTPGYTRQDVIFSNLPSGQITSAGTTGRGVSLTEVRRMYDSFVNLQLTTERSNLAYADVYEKGVVRMENIFNEASDNGLAPAIVDFFNAWQDVSQNPEGYAQRTLLIKKAEYLTSRINRAYISLEEERMEIYKNAQSLVKEINSITPKITELNSQIASSPGGLDLKDQRDELIRQLNDIAKVTYFEDSAGRYTVMLGGTPLVDGAKTFKMTSATDTSNKMHFYVEILDIYGNVAEQRDVTTLMTGGELKANIDLRDTKIPEYMNELNALTIDLADLTNYYHKQGFGLDISNGNNFFSSPLSSVTDPAGGGSISSVGIKRTIVDTFTIDGANKTIEFNVGGPSLFATLTEGTYTADELAAELKTQLEAADGVANIYTVVYNASVRKFTVNNLSASASNINILWTASGTTAENHFGFTSDSAIAIGGSDASNTAASTKSASSFDYVYKEYTITYNPNGDGNNAAESIGDYAISYGSAPTNVSAVLTIDSGGFGRTLEFNGIKVRIEGDMSAAETFKFQLNEDMARTVTVSVSDPRQVAAATGSFAIDSSNSIVMFNDGINRTAALIQGRYTGEELAAELKRALEAVNADRFVINAGVNDAIRFDNGAIRNATIAPGTYTGEQLAAQVQAALNLAGGGIETYTVSYDSNSKKFSIANDAGNANAVDILWEDAVNTTATQFLGFNAVDHSSFRPGSYTASDDSVSSSLYTSDTYTVVYNPSINKFKIINDSGNANAVDILWENASTTAEQIFGFSGNHPAIAVGGYDKSDNSVSSYAANGIPGDNRNSKVIAGLISQTVIDGGSLNDFYRQMVSDVGVETLSAKQSQKFLNTLVKELESRREELSGVSLDEEAVNLIKYQKSFEAAAKMISIAEELLTTLLNMTGR